MMQFLLAALSLLAVWCLTSTDLRMMRWGPVFGLMSQPFWLYETYTQHQWGMLLLSAVYVVMWCRGIRNCWLYEAPDRSRWTEPLRLLLAILLIPLVLNDYRLRRLKRRPDRWYWGDTLLVRLGYAILMDVVSGELEAEIG